jgi:hypothetical protein
MEFGMGDARAVQFGFQHLQIHRILAPQ